MKYYNILKNKIRKNKISALFVFLCYFYVLVYLADMNYIIRNPIWFISLILSIVGGTTNLVVVLRNK